MADTKISDLTAVTDVLATDEYVLARSGATRKIDASDLAAGLSTGAGLHDAYVLIVDEKTANTNGGAATTGNWFKRDLTTEKVDTAGIASLASSVVTLDAGTYDCKVRSPFLATQRAKIRLRNTTDGATLLVGTSEYADVNTDPGTCSSHIVGQFTLAGQKTLEVQYQVGANAAGATSVLGIASNFGEVEVYTILELWRVV